MKIVVTGSLGQLGYELMRQAKESQHTYIFTDVRESELTTSLDITDAEAVEAFIGEDVDVIINCAAYTDVNAAEDNEPTAYGINAVGVKNLAESVAAENALLIHISTDYVFGDKENTPISETSRPSPLNAYGRTKWEGEQAIIKSGCRHIILRTSWLYSPYGKNFVKTMLQLMASRTEIRVVCDQVGCPTNAEDLANVILTIINVNFNNVFIF